MNLHSGCLGLEICILTHKQEISIHFEAQITLSQKICVSFGKQQKKKKTKNFVLTDRRSFGEENLGMDLFKTL